MISDEAIELLRHENVRAYLAVAAATCALYDHVTTLDEEIELVWRRKWSVVQMLFLFNRYAGDALLIYSAFVFVRHTDTQSQKNCNLANLLLGFLGGAVVSSMQGIMVLRVSSMYNNSRKIKLLLLAAFSVEGTTSFIMQIIDNTSRYRRSNVVAGVSLCRLDNFAPWSYAIWIPLVCFESLVFFLSVSLAIKYHQSLKDLPALSPFLSRQSLLFILLRDSITFPCIFMTICLVNVFAWMYPPYKVAELVFTLAALAPCVIGSRLVLNLREAYYRPFSEECNAHEMAWRTDQLEYLNDTQ